MKHLGEIIFTLKNFIKYLKTGGVVYVNVAFVNPSERFLSKKVLITGGTSGLGLEMAKEFLAEGATVLICARNNERLRMTKEEIGHPNLHIMSFDVSKIDSIPAKIEEAHSIIGDIDIFVNSAGVTDYLYNSMNSETMYDYIVNTNQKGLFFICKEQGDYLKTRKRPGKIINITSKAGELLLFDPYTLSKWGANCITQGLAKQLASDNIIVNGIAPGCVPTNITAALQSHDVKKNAYYPGHTTRRFTLVEEVASLALFLASDAANNIVGQIINIDGGIYE